MRRCTFAFCRSPFAFWDPTRFLPHCDLAPSRLCVHWPFQPRAQTSKRRNSPARCRPLPHAPLCQVDSILTSTTSKLTKVEPCLGKVEPSLCSVTPSLCSVASPQGKVSRCLGKVSRCLGKVSRPQGKVGCGQGKVSHWQGNWHNCWPTQVLSKDPVKKAV